MDDAKVAALEAELEAMRARQRSQDEEILRLRDLMASITADDSNPDVSILVHDHVTTELGSSSAERAVPLPAKRWATDGEPRRLLQLTTYVSPFPIRGGVSAPPTRLQNGAGSKSQSVAGETGAWMDQGVDRSGSTPSGREGSSLVFSGSPPHLTGRRPLLSEPLVAIEEKLDARSQRLESSLFDLRLKTGLLPTAAG